MAGYYWDYGRPTERNPGGGKKFSHYEPSKSGKTRRPVYTDGSKGSWSKNPDYKPSGFQAEQPTRVSPQEIQAREEKAAREAAEAAEKAQAERAAQAALDRERQQKADEAARAAAAERARQEQLDRIRQGQGDTPLDQWGTPTTPDRGYGEGIYGREGSSGFRTGQDRNVNPDDGHPLGSTPGVRPGGGRGGLPPTDREPGTGTQTPRRTNDDDNNNNDDDVTPVTPVTTPSNSNSGLTMQYQWSGAAYHGPGGSCLEVYGYEKNGRWIESRSNVAKDQTKCGKHPFTGKTPEPDDDDDDDDDETTDEKKEKNEGSFKGKDATLYRVQNANGDDWYALGFDWEGQTFLFQFDNSEQQKAILGDDWAQTWKNRTKTITDQDVREEWTGWKDGQPFEPAEEYFFAGRAGVVADLEGTFQQMIENSMRDSFRTTSLNDPTVQGRVNRDPAVQKLLGLKALLGWSDEYFQAELRKTTIYHEIYPGIQTFFGRTSEPEAAWRNYYQAVEEGLRSLGYKADKDGSYREVIGELLKKGVAATEFNKYSSVIVRARESSSQADALNIWLRRYGQPEITAEDWIDILSGTSDRELDDIVERASLQHEATQQGLALSLDQIDHLASNTSLSGDEHRQALSVTGQQLGILGVTGLQRSGLTVDHLLAGNTGRSFNQMSADEIRRRVAETGHELGSSDDFRSVVEPRRRRRSS